MTTDWGQVLASVLDLLVVGLFAGVFFYVARWYAQAPRARTLEPLVVAVNYLAGSVALLIASWSLRYLSPDEVVSVWRIVIAAMRVMLLISGIWLVIYWRSRR